MKEEISSEINRCLQCQNPICEAGCPLHNKIKTIIKLIKENKEKQAREVLAQTSINPQICAKLCPAYKLCMGHCVLSKKNQAINIPLIENYLAENNSFNYEKKPANDKSCVIIGAGPSGLACAHKLALEGFSVTIIEKKENGGILKVGIPGIRFDKQILTDWLKELKDLNINFQKGEFGVTHTLEQLQNEYDYIYLATGAQKAKVFDIKNKELKNIYTGIDFLEKGNRILENQSDEKFDIKNLIILGGGNVALDCCLSAKALGIENITLIYRRTIEEAPACRDDFELLEEKGIKMFFKRRPKEFLGKDKVEEIVVEQMIKEGNEYKPANIFENFNCDAVVMAFGFETDDSYFQNIKLELHDHKPVTHHFETSISNVYAGGDVIRGSSNVALAISDGLSVAMEIINKENIL